MGGAGGLCGAQRVHTVEGFLRDEEIEERKQKVEHEAGRGGHSYKRWAEQIGSQQVPAAILSTD